MDETGWLAVFGTPLCIVEDIAVLHWLSWNWCVRRVLYDDNRAVDFSVVPFTHLDEVLSINKEIIDRGYRVIYDAGIDLLGTKICALFSSGQAQRNSIASDLELRAIIDDLLFHAVWSYKKIKKKELWVAVDCINNHMNRLLLRLIEAYTACVDKRSDLITYDGRFLERRTDAGLLKRLAGCFTHYDETDAIETLGRLVDSACSISQAIFEANGYAFDHLPFERIKTMLIDMERAL